MRANHVKKRLRAGEPSVGTWLSLPSPEAAEHISAIGFDWLVVDAEHSPMDIRTISQMMAAMTYAGVAPMVRVPWNTPENFKRVLDAGAWGIVVPMVNSRAEAEQAAAAMRYPPVGQRSVGGGRQAVSFATTAERYYRHANDELLLVVQIEHITAVEHAADILSVPGVDACFIGPNDLAASMGIGLGVAMESDHPRMIEAIDHVRRTCVTQGVAPGIHCSGAAGVRQRIGEGFQFCAMASELRYMLSGLRAELSQIQWQASAPQMIGAEEHEIEGTTVRY